MSITVVGTPDGIVMIESGAKQVSEDSVVDAIEFAHTEIKKICAGITELVAKAGKPKREVKSVEFDQAYYDQLYAKVGDRLKDALDTHKHPKFESYALVKQIKDELKAALPADDATAPAKLLKYYESLRENIFRDQVTKDRVRPDRRQ
ncbi:polynucleotide phosphorylase/polyadenylase, partial [mine drainage metagenome]